MQAVRPKQAQKAKAKQATDTSTRQFTQQESLGAIKLLVHAGLGSIAFLRGLFPERCFKDDRIDDIVSLPDSKGNQGRSGARVKSLKRGQLPETDTVLDYLDGVYDALGKGYLKTFMMGVYLDPDHPYQLIELYTFNFVYRDIEGINGEKLKVADMEFKDQLRDRVISKHSDNPPSTSTSALGAGGNNNGDKEEEYPPEMRAKWTIASAREQAQKLIKSLITMTQVLDTLPRVKYLTFKLYYTPETPDDYEPPHFKSVDSEVAKFMVGTKSADAKPESNVYGQLDTGHHCMTVRMMTVAKQLPDQDELAASQVAGPPVKDEASQRPVLWPAEELVIDEECDTSYETLSEQEAKLKKRKPLGMMGSDGSLDPASQVVAGLEEVEEILPLMDGRAEEEEPNRMPRTFTYSMGPDLPDDVEMVKDLTDGEALRLAAQESNDQYTMETHPLSRIPTLCDPPAGTSTNGTPQLNAHEESPPLRVFDALEATQTLPRGTALARDESSIAFSSIFGEREKSREEVLHEEQIEESIGMSKGKGKETISIVDEAASSAMESPILPYSQAEETTMSKELPLPLDTHADSSRTQLDTAGEKRSIAQVETVADVPSASKPMINVDTTEEAQASAPKRPAQAKSAILDRQSSLSSVEEEDAEGDDEPMDCDCGDNEISDFEVPMVACDVCKAWKHMTCYGDLRRGAGQDEAFLCYECQIKPRDHPAHSREEEANREMVLQELSSLTLFRRMLHVIYEDKPYNEARTLAKRLQCDLPTAKELVERAKEEEFLTSPILAEDSMQSSGSSSGKTKRGRAKKVKASDFMPNRSQRILKMKREKYFTPGEGEEKVIIAKLITSTRRVTPSIPAPNVEEAGATSVPPTVTSPETTVPPRSPAKLPVSPSRKALTNISNSPRASRTAPAENIEEPQAVVAKTVATSAARADEDEHESYLPTPQTTERSTAPAAVASSSVSPPVAIAPLKAFTGTTAAKSAYKSLVPRSRVDTSAVASSAVAPSPRAGIAQLSTTVIVSTMQTSAQVEQREDSTSSSQARKRTAAEAELDDDTISPLKKHLPSPKRTNRKASLATGVRARDERDDNDAAMYDDADFDMGDIDESATEYSTEVRM